MRKHFAGEEKMQGVENKIQASRLHSIGRGKKNKAINMKKKKPLKKNLELMWAIRKLEPNQSLTFETKYIERVKGMIAMRKMRGMGEYKVKQTDINETTLTRLK